MNEKIKAFEYIISLLVDWLMELTDVDEETAPVVVRIFEQ